MLIISKHKDYYDTAIGYGGIDKTIVYKRKEIEIIDPERYSNDYNKYLKFFRDNLSDVHSFPFRYRIGFFNFDIYFHMIIFCGEVYPFFELYYFDQKRQKAYFQYFYSFDKIKKYIKKRFYKDLKHSKWDKNGVNFFKNLKNFYDSSININKLRLFDYHRSVDSPVILYEMSKKKVVLNPVLSKYNFYKIYDPFQTYQKIEMFLSGVMGTGEKEIIEIDDKSLRDKKGFNDMSFKKEKEK